MKVILNTNIAVARESQSYTKSTEVKEFNKIDKRNKPTWVIKKKIETTFIKIENCDKP